MKYEKVIKCQERGLIGITAFGQTGSKPYSHTYLLFFFVRAESLGAISGAIVVPLSLCLRSQDNSEALYSFTFLTNLQC